jgi:hypothetical protein
MGRNTINIRNFSLYFKNGEPERPFDSKIGIFGNNDAFGG